MPFEIGLHTSEHGCATSPYGRDESNAKNNHGTYYDLQVAIYALYADQPAIAKRVLEEAREKRIDAQIESDGRQPLELARTRSFSYSVMNIDGLTQLATVGDRVGVDLWNHTRKGSTTPAMREALLYLAPYALGDTKWPHQQIGGWDPESLFPVLRRARMRSSGVTARVPVVGTADRSVLTSAAARYRQFAESHQRTHEFRVAEATVGSAATGFARQGSSSDADTRQRRELAASPLWDGRLSARRLTLCDPPRENLGSSSLRLRSLRFFVVNSVTSVPSTQARRETRTRLWTPV